MFYGSARALRLYRAYPANRARTHLESLIRRQEETYHCPAPLLILRVAAHLALPLLVVIWRAGHCTCRSGEDCNGEMELCRRRNEQSKATKLNVGACQSKSTDQQGCLCNFISSETRYLKHGRVSHRDAHMHRVSSGRGFYISQLGNSATRWCDALTCYMLHRLGPGSWEGATRGYEVAATVKANHDK